MSLAPVLHLNRKLCEHSLRNKVESSEITLLNLLNTRVRPAIQHLVYVQQKQKEFNKNRKDVGFNSTSVMRNKENSFFNVLSLW